MGNIGSWASNGWESEEVDLWDWRSAVSSSLTRAFNCCISESEAEEGDSMILLG